MSHPRHIVLPFLLLAPAVLAQTREVVPTTGPTVWPCDGITEHGGERWLTTRAVDGITGLPLANAEMLLVEESPHPLRGTLWFERRIAADAEGFLRARIDANAPDAVKWGWVVIRAPGYGPWCEMGSPPGPITRLAPAVDAPVRVLDRLGNPVAGALLGLCGGCGHTPDLVWGTSDATGLVTLRGVDLFMNCNDLYVEHPDLGLAYTGLSWMPGEPPMYLRVAPAVAAYGVVLDGAGKPMPGVHVGTKLVHRGPWTKTDARGAFRLCGGDADDDLWVHLGDREVLFERAATMPLRLQLPAPDGKPVQVVDLPRPADVATCLVQARVEGAHGEPLSGARVRWIGPAPARDEIETFFYEPVREVALRPGRYDVIASADDHGATTSAFVVPDAPSIEHVLRPRALPTMFVRALDLPDKAMVELLTATGRRDIGEQVRRGIAIGVPEEPFWLQVDALNAPPRTFAFTPEQALARGTVRVPWYRPTRLEGRLVDGDGKPAQASLALIPCGRGLRGLPEADALEWHVADGAIAWQTEHTGFACLVVRHAQVDERVQVLPLILPPRGDDAVLELGTIAVDAPVAVQLRDAAGAPLTGARVAFVRTGWTDVRDETPPTFPLDDDGGWRGPKPQAGDALLVLPPADDEAAPDAPQPKDRPVARDLPVRFLVQGDGPWTFTLPAGELEIDVRGDDDTPLRCTVVLGAESVEVQGATRLRRVPAGPLRVYIASPGRMSAVADVDVPASGVVAVRCRLPQR